MEVSCIDLILTRGPNFHQRTQLFESGMSDHHVMIYNVKSVYTMLEPLVYISCDIKFFLQKPSLKILNLG